MKIMRLSLILAALGTAIGCTQSGRSTSGPTATSLSPSDAHFDVSKWMNRTYSTSCAGVRKKRFSVTVRNGKGRAYPPGIYQYYDVSVESTASGDLMGDSSPEVAVLLWCAPTPSNFARQEVSIFSTGGKYVATLPALEYKILPPIFEPDEFFVVDTVLVTGLRHYDSGDSHGSGPSRHTTIKWRWTGKAFSSQ